MVVVLIVNQMIDSRSELHSSNEHHMLALDWFKGSYKPGFAKTHGVKMKETALEVRVVSDGGTGRGVVEFRLPNDRIATAAVHIRREAWEKPTGD
jgi:hypothetical protein